jgi:DNA-binding IclR family transcriptional regulator
VTGNLSLERGLAVLDVMRDASEALGVREIARRLELSAPAVQRIVNTLAQQGYVEQAPDSRRYRLGHAVLALAQQALAKDRLAALAEPELELLAGQGCFNAFLGIRRGSTGVYVLTVQSKSPVVIRSSPGGGFSLHSTAMGKALLMGVGEGQLADILGNGPFERLTPRTVTDPPKLIEQIHLAEKIGYATSIDENFAGLIGVGAPLRDVSGSIVGAISVAYPRSVGPHVEIAEVGELILAAAARISASLGFRDQTKQRGEDPRDAA